MKVALILNRNSTIGLPRKTSKSTCRIRRRRRRQLDWRFFDVSNDGCDCYYVLMCVMCVRMWRLWHICDYVTKLSHTMTLILWLLWWLTHLWLLWRTCFRWWLWFCDHYNNWHICDYCDEPVPDGDFDFVTTLMIDTFVIIVMNLSHMVTMMLWLL